MNHLVYPLDETRFVRDLAARAPRSRVLGTAMGRCYLLRRGSVEAEEPDPVLLQLPQSPPDDRLFRPYELPALTDPNPAERSDDELMARTESWARTNLLASLVSAYSTMGLTRPALLALSIVGPQRTLELTFIVDEQNARVEAGLSPDYDVLNAVAASQLLDVIEGRRHWGEPLLGGFLRSSSRAYQVDARGLQPARVAPLFLYYCIGYDESVERAVEHALDALG